MSNPSVDTNDAFVGAGLDPGSGQRPVWVDGDVMITRKGLYIPAPGNAPPFPDMLVAMRGGTAGNPVFTDSRDPV